MAGEAETRSPEEIRREIEETREELGETVEALAAKADVKGQAKERISEVKERAQEKVTEAKGKAKEATPPDAAASADAAREKVRRNPLPFAVGAALAAGFALGRLTA
jgi:ElaB/YqjD/DUF883 family membrane-anchored ribosome-binding protein